MYITPNIFAYFVFFSWPLVIFKLLSKYPAPKAVLLSITLSLLLLPCKLEFDFPLLPPIDKNSLTVLFLVIFLFIKSKKFRIFQPGPVTKLLIIYFIMIIISTELNMFPFWSGKKFLKGMTHYDVISTLVRAFLDLMPFFLGRFFLNNFKDNEGHFKIIILLCLYYSLPMIFEIVMSPQIHRLVYGYHAASFIQQMRGDGFRPTVMMGHGLNLAFWFATSAFTACAFYKNKIRVGKFTPLMLIAYILLMLILAKTWSALFYLGIAFLLITRISPQKQIAICLIASVLVLAYPMAKVAGVFPDRELVSNINQYSPERAQSLQFRFENEEMLLKHALEQPYFGWGGWGRNHVYSSYDGRDDTITDGFWIIQMGVYGICGFIAYYAILITPIFYALKTVRYIADERQKVYFAALAIMLFICILDSVPNAGMGPMHLLFAGALLGQAETLLKEKKLNGVQNKRA